MNIIQRNGSVTIYAPDILMKSNHQKIVNHAQRNDTRLDVQYKHEYAIRPVDDRAKRFTNYKKGEFIKPRPYDRMEVTTHNPSNKGGTLEPTAHMMDTTIWRKISFHSLDEIGFSPNDLVCVAGVWMHVDFYPFILKDLQRERSVNPKMKGDPPAKWVREAHARAKKQLIEKVSTNKKREVTNRNGMKGDDYDVQSEHHRFTRNIKQEVHLINTVKCRTWNDTYAPAGVKHHG